MIINQAASLSLFSILVKNLQMKKATGLQGGFKLKNSSNMRWQHSKDWQIVQKKDKINKSRLRPTLKHEKIF